MSKAIDFFKDLEKREKAMFDALCTKEILGIKTFWCKLEGAWIMPEACLRRQKFYERSYSFGNDSLRPYIKCSDCEMAEKIQAFYNVKIKLPKNRTLKLVEYKAKTTRTCKICGKELPFTLQYFPRAKNKPAGYVCLKCKREQVKKIWQEKQKKKGVKKTKNFTTESFLKVALKNGIDKEGLKSYKNKQKLMQITGLALSSIYHHTNKILND
jgi:hypothetical protein